MPIGTALLCCVGGEWLGEGAVDLAAELLFGGKAYQAVDFLAVLEDYQGGDAGDAVFDHCVFVFVGVHFGEADCFAVFVAEFFYYGADHAAGAAPGSPEVDYDGGFRG